MKHTSPFFNYNIINEIRFIDNSIGKLPCTSLLYSQNTIFITVFKDTNEPFIIFNVHSFKI